MRGLDMKGDLPELVDPRFQLGIAAQDFTGPEFSWLRRESRVGHSITSGASVGNFSTIEFGLYPSPSDVNQRIMVVVDKIIISNGNANAGRMFWGLIDKTFAGGAGPGTQFDDRDVVPGAGAIPGVVFGAAANPAAATLIQPACLAWIQGGSNLTVDYPFILTNKRAVTGGNPRNVLAFCSGELNVAWSVTIMYRYREILSSELL